MTYKIAFFGRSLPPISSKFFAFESESFDKVSALLPLNLFPCNYSTTLPKIADEKMTETKNIIVDFIKFSDGNIVEICSTFAF